MRAVQLRRTAGWVARKLAGWAGFELVRRRAQASASANPSGSSSLLEIPAGRSEPFSIGDYDVVPTGDYDIVKRDYYSPIPDLTLVPEDVWTRRGNVGGLDLSTDTAIAFVERELAPRIGELNIPKHNSGVSGEFFLANEGFETVDAEILYAMVRAMRPRRVIELGSGYTSLLINMACRRNALDNVNTVHEAYDPYPRPHILGEALTGPSKLTAISATDVPLEVFSGLESGDILFVDTTHTVKLGSDVNFVILEVLPVLQPGVSVHFHDVFIPWEYPRQWFAEMHWYWAEQYLLQAFLAYNRDFEILVPAHALSRDHPERLQRVIPSFVPGGVPGSMWLRRL